VLISPLCDGNTPFYIFPTSPSPTDGNSFICFAIKCGEALRWSFRLHPTTCKTRTNCWSSVARPVQTPFYCSHPTPAKSFPYHEETYGVLYVLFIEHKYLNAKPVSGSWLSRTSYGSVLSEYFVPQLHFDKKRGHKEYPHSRADNVAPFLSFFLFPSFFNISPLGSSQYSRPIFSTWNPIASTQCFRPRA